MDNKKSVLAIISETRIIHILLSIILGFVVGAFFLLIMGLDVGAAYGRLITSVTSVKGISYVIVYSIPYIMTGLSVAFSFRTGIFNIGAEGQFVLGSMAAACVGILFGSLPSVILIPLCFIAAMLAGALWGAIVGILKNKWGINEVLSMIMFNWIAFYLSNFIARRMDAIKKAYVNDNILELDVDANFYMGKTRVFYNLELIGSLPSDVEQEIQGSDLKIVERVTKLQRIISDFLSSPFAKQMVNSAPVRPPITRTNVILKNPDFKKALVLWQFIESYSKMGFSVENVSEKMAVDEDVETAVSDMMFMCNSLMEGLVQNKVEDSLFFSESNMTEQEIEEQEKEVEKEKEEEKTEETPTPESVEVPSPEEQEGETGEEGEEQETQAEEEKQQEQEEEEELPDEFGVAELRNLFQQTEGKVDKAQLARINKAIDRVLLNESTLRAKKKSEIAEIRFRQQEIEQEKLLKEMEKEKLALERSLAKKEKIAAKERESLEKQKERDRKRLQKLEEEMREKQEALQSQEIAADVEQREDLGEVEDLSVKPMLAALKEDGAGNNAAIETPARDEVAADANEEQGATAEVGSEGVAEQDGENNFPEENAAAAENEDLNSDGNALAERGEKLSSEAVDETENNDGRQEE